MRRAMLLLVLCAACGGKPSAHKCEEVADHMLDVFVNPTGATLEGGAAQKAEEERKKFRTATPTRAYLIERCKDHMSNDRADCILKAEDEKAVAACGK